MKNLLLAIAALFAVILPTHVQAAPQSSVSIDLTGATLQGGKTLKLSSNAAILAAPVYFYSISGTVSANGDLQTIFSGGDIRDLFAAADPSIVPFLSGTLVNASGKLPFTPLNITRSGTVNVSGPPAFTVVGSAHVEASIAKSGTATITINNLSFGIKTHGITIKDKSDAFTFTGGQVIVSTNPPTGAFQPDLSFKAGGDLFGVGITGNNLAEETFSTNLKSKGQKFSLPVILQNNGTTADTFTVISSSVAANGFTQAILYKGKNITTEVTTDGALIPPNGKGGVTVTLAPGEIAALVWQVANKSAVRDASNFTSFVLTATSSGDSTKTDSLEFDVDSVTPQ